MIVVAIIGTLASITAPSVIRAAYRARIARAIMDIKTLGTEIDVFELEYGRLPADLGEIKRSYVTDPWGRPYEYMSFEAAGPGWKGVARKDHNLVPLNSSYDLYSKGEDGESVSPLTAKVSHDDVIRANDGGYVGLASEY